MESLKQLNMAMAYIEANLDREIDFQKVAQLACCSEYHFRRMFSFLSGMSLSEYIRSRRLSQAALEIANGKVKVIELAVRYGYESADAFSRAFQALYGISPSEARSSGVVLKAFPPMSFQFSIQGGKQMEYRIIEKPAFHIVGIKKRVKLQYKSVNPEIAAIMSGYELAEGPEILWNESKDTSSPNYHSEIWIPVKKK